MIVIVNILLICFVAFCTACLSRFLDFSMEQGNILAWWYAFILKIGNVKTDSVGSIVSCNLLFKPLGGCLVCMNFWIGVMPFIWIFSKLSLSPFDGFFAFWAFQSLSSFFLVTMEKHLK